MTKSHWWRVLKRDTYLKVLITVAILLCIVLPLQTVADDSVIPIEWPKIPLYNWSNPNEIPDSLTVNQFHARTDPGTGVFMAEFYAFPTKDLGESPAFIWNFNDGSVPVTSDLPEASHPYGPGIYYPNVTVQPTGGSPYDVSLPMPLVVVGGTPVV